MEKLNHISILYRRTKQLPVLRIVLFLLDLGSMLLVELKGYGFFVLKSILGFDLVGEWYVIA